MSAKAFSNLLAVIFATIERRQQIAQCLKPASNGVDWPPAPSRRVFFSLDQPPIWKVLRADRVRAYWAVYPVVRGRVVLKIAILQWSESSIQVNERIQRIDRVRARS